MSGTRRNSQAGLATRAIHLGYDPASEQGSLNPPIYMTSTYVFETAEAGSEMFKGERAGYIYGRTRNPTQAILEERIASLEGGEAAMTAGSGMAAISSTMLSLLQAGDEVIVDHTLYGNTFAYFTQGLPPLGIVTRVVDCTDVAAVAAATNGKTKIIYFETPANPNLRLIDIAEMARIARGVGARIVVDNTFATPVFQRPLEQGAAIVVHSATKYLGGHGDLLAGVVVGSKDDVNRIRSVGLRFMTGATLSPFNCFLIMRGLKTLDVRMERHASSALALARMLEGHDKIASVSYPGLDSFPQAELARRQMSKPGGLVAFELDGGLELGMAFMNELTLISRAVSLGDCETLVQHPASMTHANYTPEERAKHGIGDGLLRLSVGLETLDDLLDDVERALGAI